MTERSPRRWVRRAVGTGYFMLIPAVSAVAPLLALPVISEAFGVDGWGSVAVGLSLGMAAGTVAELGWSVVGPQAVAGGDERERAELFANSRATKIVAVIVLAPLAGVLAGALTPTYQLDAAILAVAGAATALGTSWFFVGLNRPLVILAVDTLPRVAAVVLAAAIISSGGPLVVYPIGLLVAALFNTIVSTRLLRYRWWPPAAAWRRVPTVVRAQSVVLVGRILGTGYTSLTVTLTAVGAPAAVPLFAAYERVMRMASAILAGVHGRLQSWLGQSRTPATRRARIRDVIVLNVVLGAAAGLVFALAAPFVVEVLFAGMFEPDWVIAAGSGLVLALVCASRGVGLAVVAVDAAPRLTAATLGACVIGLPLLLILPARMGPSGAVVAEIAAETAGLVTLALVLRSRLRKEPEERRGCVPARPAASSTAGPLRVVVVADGDPRDPRTNSGVAAGLVGAFDSRKDVDVVAVVDSTPRRGAARLLTALLTFHPSRDEWRRRFQKGVLGIRLRSQTRDRALRHVSPFDLVIHVRNTYLPTAASYVTFVDGTTSLAQREWSGWALAPRVAARRIRQERRQFDSALRVWTAGEHVAEEVVAGYGVPRSKVAAVGGGTNFLPDLTAETSLLRDDAAERTVLFVGGDFDRKGGPELLDAFAQVRASLSDARLVVVGPEAPEHVPDGVEWLGRVDDREELARRYISAGVFCLPARYEPYGLVVQEAQAFGLACVVSDTGSLPALVAHGAAGLVVPRGDVDRLAVSLLEVLNDGELRERLRQTGRELAAGLGWDVVAERALSSLPPGMLPVEDMR